MQGVSADTGHVKERFQDQDECMEDAKVAGQDLLVSSQDYSFLMGLQPPKLSLLIPVLLSSDTIQLSHRVLHL